MKEPQLDYEPPVSALHAHGIKRRDIFKPVFTTRTSFRRSQHPLGPIDFRNDDEGFFSGAQKRDILDENYEG